MNFEICSKICGAGWNFLPFEKSLSGVSSFSTTDPKLCMRKLFACFNKFRYYHTNSLDKRIEGIWRDIKKTVCAKKEKMLHVYPLISARFLKTFAVKLVPHI